MFRLTRPLFCLCVFTVAPASISAGEPEAIADTAAAVERPALQPRSETMAADLARQLPAKEIIILEAGDEAFIGLWRPANVAEPKGLVILLPGEGETADWPRGIGPLRRALPDHSWHTLSISLPDPPGFLAPEKPEPGLELPTEEQAESATEDTEQQAAPNEAGYLPEEAAALPDASPPETVQDEARQAVTTDPDKQLPLAERIDERIDAALAYARSRQPERIVLLGQGTGGYWAARHLQQFAPGDVQHLLLIQPRQPEGQEEPLDQLVTTLKLATGDFHYRNGNARAEARERLNASRRIGHPAYHQIGLPTQIDDRATEQQQLLRRVRGWLDRP